MSALVFAHIFCLGIWLGCVAVEAVLEWRGWRDDSSRKRAAEAHFWIDLLVELPVLAGVVTTGSLLLWDAHFTGVLIAKIALGSSAVLINLVCVFFVLRRRGAAVKDDSKAVRRWSTRINWTFPFGVPCALAAFAIGLHLLGYF